MKSGSSMTKNKFIKQLISLHLLNVEKTDTYSQYSFMEED
jgi:hypothetical protein